MEKRTNKIKKLNFEGVESITTDIYYDIINGYYTDEIKDEKTVKVLKKAISIIEKLADYLHEKDLVQ